MTANKRPFRIIKPEIRVLGVDDGKFTPHTKGESIVVGVVFRGRDSVEGVMHTHVVIDGLDATDKIASMINKSPHRHQLRLVMLNGVTVAGFNLVNIGHLYAATGMPVLVVTRDKPDLDAIHSALGNLPQSAERWAIVQAAGELYEVSNHGAKLYVELAGLSLEEAQSVLELTSKRGSLPEPLRVAHLVASGVTP